MKIAKKNRLAHLKWAWADCIGGAGFDRLTPNTGHVKVRVRVGIVGADHNLTDVTRALTELFADRRSIKRKSHVSDLDVRWDKTVEPGP
jgi:hypothetical protein